MNDWLLFLIGLAIVAAFGYVAWRRARLETDRVRREQMQLARERDDYARQVALADRQLAALGQAVLEVILVLDRDLRVTHATAGAHELFNAEHVAGQSLIEFTRSAELDQLAIEARTANGVADDARGDLDRVMSIAGRPHRVRAAAFGDGVVLALSDVSELQRLGRARRDFVANISHELRTPLTSIRLVLDSLLSGAVRDPDESTGLLRKIQIEVDALQQMAQELLDLAQIESGRALVRLVPVSAAQLAADAVDRLSAQAQRKRQIVHIDIPPQLAALADVEQMGRALGNLLHNAIKFTPPEGRITVRARAQDGDVLFEIVDTGPGISHEDQPRVFERFFRGDRSRAGGGTGLGLAIARHVVEAHGGRIWVESDGLPGHGATFRFTLPLA